MKFHVSLFVSCLNVWKMITVHKKLSLRIQIILINSIKSVEIDTRGHRQSEKVRSTCFGDVSFVFNLIFNFFFIVSDLQS